jgi:hypothetical protein
MCAEAMHNQGQERGESHMESAAPLVGAITRPHLVMQAGGPGKKEQLDVTATDHGSQLMGSDHFVVGEQIIRT